jgi:uncharacterized protein YqgV (UPF0045/DUF77 family)
MGVDKIYQTFYKMFGGTEYFEEENYQYNFHQLGTERIILDGYFILYQIIYQIENDLNDIIKLILGIPHNSEEKRKQIINLIIKKIDETKLSKFKEKILEIFELENIFEMIEKLKEILSAKNRDNIYYNILTEYYLEYLETKILKLHYLEFLQEFIIIFDGIPTFSKIIEQKRRRIKNFIESTIRKISINDSFNNLPNVLSEITFKNLNFYLDYSEFIKNRISLSKSFGPSSNIFKLLQSKIKEFFKNNYPKIKLLINQVSTYGEGDFKIYHLLKEIKKSTTIHCSDFDFIFYGLMIQQEYHEPIYLIRHFNTSYLLINFKKLIDGIIFFFNLKFNYFVSNNIISDICLISTFFGNDFLPGLIELNFENDFLTLIEIVNNLFWQHNKFLVYNKKIDYEKLKVFFLELSKKINRIYLENYLKSLFFEGNTLCKILPSEITTLTELKNNLLEPYWINKLKEENDSLKKNFPIKYPEINQELEKILIVKNNFYGLTKKERYPDLEDNPYQNLYNNQVFISQNYSQEFFPTLENRLNFIGNLNETEEEEKYLRQISINFTEPKNIVNKYFELLELYFNKFTEPLILSLSFYPFYLAPKVEWITEYFPEKVSFQTIKPENFFDNILHLIFISAHQNMEETEDSWLIEFINNHQENFVILDENKKLTLESLKEMENIKNYRNVNISELIENWKIYLTNLNYIYLKSNLPLLETNFETKLIDNF